MKIRMRSNSVRLRLSQPEVTRFAAGEIIEEVIDFGGGHRFIYRLCTQASGPLSARMNGSEITLSVPSDDADQWTSTDRVGIQYDQEIGNGRVLNLLVEKDFACLEPRGEEDLDSFPHPMACG